MGATDLIFDCNATTFDDVIINYNNEINREKKYGYNSIDDYEPNVLAFEGIECLSGIANNREDALNEVLDNSYKWGPALVKFYKHKDIDKKTEKEMLKVHKKIKKQFDLDNNKKKNRIKTIIENCKKKLNNYTTCCTCKSKISNNYINTCLTVDGKNQCVVCKKSIIDLKAYDEKIEKSSKEYYNLSHVYKAIWGGMVSC